MFNIFKRSSKVAKDQINTGVKGTNMIDTPVNERIKKEINSQDVMVFMKGSPMFPQCGFSAATVQALSMA